MASSNSWHSSVPDHEAFAQKRAIDTEAMAKNLDLRETGLELLQSSNQFGFGHKNSWLGVPIIRLPEDMVIQQEIIWNEKPDLIIEVGVARGGGLLFNASIQAMCGLTPNVIGVDNKIFDHTKIALSGGAFTEFIRLIEGDSVSEEVLNQVSRITSSSEKVLLVLDSDHSSEHVFSELQNYVPLLPKGSIIIVCDTLIDEYPPGTYKDRSWSNGKGPLDAINRFRAVNSTVTTFMSDETRALILTEIRDGILRKIQL
jgi:cephalosporin hydroxylase